MIIRQLSIPFDSNSESGHVDVSILSSEKFLENARRTGAVSASIFCKAKPIFRGSKGCSYLYLPNEVTLNKFTPSCNEGLKIVCDDHTTWIGFIPFCDSSDQSQKKCEIRKMNPFSHHRINNLSIFPQRINSNRNAPCLFALPPTVHLHQKSSSQLCSILNVSFLLLFNCKRCALFCCEGPLPIVSPVPVLCCKEQSCSKEPPEKRSRGEEQGESSQKAVKESRRAKKKGKVTAEEARKKAEEARKKAEEARKKAEEARKKAEEARKRAEEAKKRAEEARKRAKEAKKENEKKECIEAMMLLHQQGQ